jgi:DNA transformation protein and related proteins
MNFAKSTRCDLTDLPNISIALGEALRRVGLASPEALNAAGAEAAWTLLQKAGVRSCIQSLLALEGAVQGVNWQALAAERRFELMRFAAQQLTELPKPTAKTGLLARAS